MKRINLLIFTAGLLLLGSCSNDEGTQEPVVKNFVPKITASIDGITEIKAGVIEDNADYASIGEQFYWSIGDASTLFFGGDRLDYTVTAVGAQRNKADFTTDGSLTGGPDRYDINAYFPTSLWDFDNLKVTLPLVQVQTDNTSKHLSEYMVMNGQSKGVTVNNENPIAMQYHHLGAVLRILVLNNSTKTNLKLKQIDFILLVPDGVARFNRSGRLEGKDADKLTMDDPSTRSNVLSLQLNGTAQDFRSEGGHEICQGYMALLPSQPLDLFGGLLLVDMTVTANEYLGDKHAGNPFSIAFELPAFLEGFKQGHSYYLKLLINDDKLPANDI